MAKCYPSAGRDDHWIPSPRCGWPLGKHLQFASKSPPFLHSFFHWKFPSIHISLAYLIFSVVRVAGGLEKNGGWPPLATSLRLQLPAGALLAVALQVLQAMRRSSLRPDAVSVDAAIMAARSWRVALELMESLGEPEMATRHWEDQ